jgi:hypothetical protein
MLSGNLNFSTHTVFTPFSSSDTVEWIWANANYGIFKIPNKYSIGIGTLDSYNEYEYGELNRTRPICVSTRYLSGNGFNLPSQLIIVNDSSGITDYKSVTAQFDNAYTIIGGKDQFSGFSKFWLHEFLLYRGGRSLTNLERIHDYLLDKWKFL